MYKVINRFIEKNHNGHVYEVGDTYPVDGKKLVKKRADELTQVHPQYGVVFLQVIEDDEKSIDATQKSDVK